MAMQKIRFVIVITLMYYYPSYGVNITDSLITQLSKNLSLKNKIETLNELSWELSLNDPKTALDYAKIARKLSHENNLNDLYATALNRIGLAHDILGNYDSAVYNYNLSFKIRLAIHDTIGAANALLNIGAAYYTQGYYNLALKNYLLSSQFIKLNGVKNNESTLAKVSNNIGLIYRVKKEYDKAIFYYTESLDLKRKLKNMHGIFNSYTNLSLAYQNLHDYAKAWLYLDSAYTLAKTPALENELAGILINKSSILKDVGKYEEALFELENSLQWLSKYPDEHSLVFYHFHKAEILANGPKLYEAIAEYNNCLTLAKKLKRRELLQSAYSALAGLYEKNGNIALALENIKLHKQVSDSIFSLESRRSVNELQTIYESKKNEEKINLLSLENEKKDLKIKQTKQTIIYTSLLISVSVISIIILFYLLKTNRNKNKELHYKNEIIQKALNEKEILLREIHHRVKNNLQIILGLLELQESTHNVPAIQKIVSEAQGRIKTMAIIHEMLYQTDTFSDLNFKEYVHKLITVIESSISCQKNVSKKHIIPQVTFNLDTVIPLGLILNELISNAFKYAFNNKEENLLTIELKKDSDEWLLLVSDSGDGIPNDGKGNREGGFGLLLVKMLSRQLNGNVSYIYNNGSCFTIRFKEKTGLHK